MVTNYLQHFDIINVKPRLYIFGQERYKTNLGGVFGIMSLITIGVLSAYFIIETFQRNTISIMYNQNSLINKTSNITKTPIAWTLVNSFGNQFPNHTRIYNYMAQYWTLDGNKDPPMSIKNVSLELCKPEHFGEFAYLFKNISAIDLHYCFSQDEDITLKGTYEEGDLGFSVIFIYLIKCVNGSAYGIDDCYPEEIIDDLLLDTYLTYYSLNYDINHNNQTDPRVPVVKGTVLTATSSLYKRYWVRYKDVSYTTDYGYVFQDLKKIDFIMFQDGYDVSVALKPDPSYPGIFSMVTLTNIITVDLYQRGYPKLQAMIANIGGVFKLVTTMSMLLTGFINSKIYFSYLTNNIFEIDSPISLSQIIEKETSVFSGGETRTDGRTNAIQNFMSKKRSQTTIKLTLRDFISPLKCANKNSQLKTLAKFQTIIKQQASIDYIIKVLNSFENMKMIIFNDEQRKLFQNLPLKGNITITNSKTRQEDERILETLHRNLKSREQSEINARLVKQFK